MSALDTHQEIDIARQQTLNRAYAQHPERFHRQLQPPQIRAEVWINKPQKETTARVTTIELKEAPRAARFWGLSQLNLGG